jgi:hypothetical protein
MVNLKDQNRGIPNPSSPVGAEHVFGPQRPLRLHDNFRRWGKILRLFVQVVLIPLLLQTRAFTQQPQAQAGQELFPVNAKYVQGFGPGYWPTAGSGLTLNLAAGTAYCNGIVRTYAGGTLTLAASATNYVYLNISSSCVPASNTTGFSSTTIPVATVATSGTSITSITDVRTMFVSSNGTVTSVGLALPSIFSVSGSPVTGSGSLTASLANQNANVILAGPMSSSAAVPTFRALIGADLPAPSTSTLGGVESLSCSSGQFLNQISTSGVPSCGATSGGSGGLGNGINVIDASTETGSTLAAKLNAAIAACPSYGCTIDARALNGAQTLDANVTFSSATQPITIVLAGAMTLTRNSGIQFQIGSNGRLIGQGKGSSVITGNDSAAGVAGIFASGAPSAVDIENLEISNSGIGPCIDLLISSAGALSSTVHDNSLNCATGILLTGYWNRIWNNNFNLSPSSKFWAGTVLDTAGSGEPNSNHLYDNVYGGGGNGTGDFVRNGYSNKFEGTQDYEGTNLAVFSAAQGQQFHFGGDVENVYCNGRTGWAASTAYGRGAIVYDSNGNCEIDVTPSASGYSTTSGTSTPTWPTTAGSTVTDGGVTWEMYPGNSGESAFIVIDKGAMTNVIGGAVGQNPNIADLDYIVNGNTSNIINVTSNSAWGNAGTVPYAVGLGANGLNFIDQGASQPGLGQVIATFNLNQFNPLAGPGALLNGASLDIPVAGNECSTYGFCGHLNLRLGTLYSASGLDVEGPASFNPLPTPAAPTVTVVGTPGSATATYYLVAHVNGGVTLPSAGTTITNVPNTLNTTNYVLIKIPTTIGGTTDPWSNATWDILKGSTSNSIYTNVRPVPSGVGDQGGSTSAYTPPSRNSTADETHYGYAYFASNVGMGTSTPAYPLHVAGTGSTVAEFDGSNQYTSFTVNNTSGMQAAVNLSQSGTQKWAYGTDFAGAGTADFFLYQATGTRNPLYIDTSGNVRLGGTSGFLGTHAMTILQTGNVGIGTASPGQRLDVTGGSVRSDTGFCISTSCVTSFFTNPMTTAGDLIYGGTSGAATRLAVGSAGTYLRSNGSNPAYSNIQATDLPANTFYQSQNSATSNAATAAATTNNINLYAFYVPNAVTTSNVGFYVQTADNTSNSYDVGAYGPGCINSAASVPLAFHISTTAGTSLAPSTGANRLALSGGPITLAPGWYCFAFTSNAATPAVVFGGQNSSVFALPFSSASTGGGGSSLPSTITAPALSWGPAGQLWMYLF